MPTPLELSQETSQVALSPPFPVPPLQLCHKWLPGSPQAWQAGPAPCMWDNIPQPQWPARRDEWEPTVGAIKVSPSDNYSRTLVTVSCTHIAKTVCESGIIWCPEILSY